MRRRILAAVVRGRGTPRADPTPGVRATHADEKSPSPTPAYRAAAADPARDDAVGQSRDDSRQQALGERVHARAADPHRARGRRRGTRASPVWRVPSSSPGPRSSRSFSAMRKPSLVSRITSSRCARQLPTAAAGTAARSSMPRCRARRGRAAGAAARGRGARRSRSPSGWRWARRRRPRSRWWRPAGASSPRLERVHHRLLFGRLHAPVHEPDAQVRQRRGRARRMRDLGRLRARAVSDSSISVHTQYACRPSAQAARMRSITSRAARSADRDGLHRRASRRQLVDHRHVEIGVGASSPACAESASRSSPADAAPRSPRARPCRAAPGAGARRSGAARRRSRARARGTRRLPASAHACRSRSRAPSATASRARCARALPVDLAGQPDDAHAERLAAMRGNCASAARRAVRSAPSARPAGPHSIARSAASAATTVLPLPTSPCTRRSIGGGRARSSRDFGADALLRAGQRERQRCAASARASDRRRAAARRGVLRDARAGVQAQVLRQQFLERQPLLRRMRARRAAPRRRHRGGGRCTVSSASRSEGSPMPARKFGGISSSCVVARQQRPAPRRSRRRRRFWPRPSVVGYIGVSRSSTGSGVIAVEARGISDAPSPARARRAATSP